MVSHTYQFNRKEHLARRLSSAQSKERQGSKATKRISQKSFRFGVEFVPEAPQQLHPSPLGIGHPNPGADIPAPWGAKRPAQPGTGQETNTHPLAIVAPRKQFHSLVVRGASIGRGIWEGRASANVMEKSQKTTLWARRYCKFTPTNILYHTLFINIRQELIHLPVGHGVH